MVDVFVDGHGELIGKQFIEIILGDAGIFRHFFCSKKVRIVFRYVFGCFSEVFDSGKGVQLVLLYIVGGDLTENGGDAVIDVRGTQGFGFLRADGLEVFDEQRKLSADVVEIGDDKETFAERNEQSELRIVFDQSFYGQAKGLGAE